MSGASLTILSNFYEEQCPQRHPQYLSGLSCALFLTTFLKIAVLFKYGLQGPCHEHIAVEFTFILAISSNREQETVSVPKCSLK